MGAASARPSRCAGPPDRDDPDPDPGPAPGPVAARLALWHARYPLLSQLVRYAIVGGGVTALNGLLFVLLRTWFDAHPANLISLVVTTALSTELNRRLAFDGARSHRLREWVQDVATVAFYAGYTSLVLLGLHAVVAGATPVQEALAVAAASLGGGLIRFVVLRYWVFDAHTRKGHSPTCSTTSQRST